MKTASQLRSQPNLSVNSSSTVVAVSLLGVLVLSVIFFSYRAQDVGRLPLLLSEFLTAFGRGQMMTGSALGSALAAVAIAVVIMLSWFGVGAAVMRWIRLETDSLALQLSWQSAIGASCWSLLWFALGCLGWLRPPIALALLGIGSALGIIAIIKNKSDWQGGNSGRQQSSGRLAMTLIAIVCLLAMIAALAPPTGKDALVYRLAVPKAYLAAGGIVDVTTNVYGFLAFGAEMNGVWAMLAGSWLNSNIVEAAFGAVAFAYLPILLLATYGLARDWALSHEWAITVAAITAAIPSMYQVAATGYVDHSLALYVVLAVHAAGKWWEAAERRHLLCLSFALGGALAIKFIALFAFFPLFIVVLFKAREAQQSDAKTANAVLLSGLAALVLAGVLASPWYLRTWIRTGSPVYPFYAHLWNGSSSNWDADRSRLFQMWVSRYGGDEKNIVDYLAAPLKLSLQAQPEIAANYDGVLGISILLGLPLLLWGLWRLSIRTEVKIAVAVAGGWYLCWLFTSEQLRFLLPACPLLAVAIAVIANQLAPSKSILQRVLLASALPGLLVIAAWFLELNPLRVVLGGEARAAYLERQLDHYPYYQIINRDLPANARVWLINMRNDTVHLEREYFADYIFEDYTITRLVKEAASLPDLRARVKAMGITHIMLRHDVIFDYARSPIVDDRKPEAENQARLNLLKSFLTEGTTTVKSDAKFMLVELPA